MVVRLNDGRESVDKLGAVGNDQMAACILLLSLCAEVSNLKQGAAHAFAQVQAWGASCSVERSLLQQGDCRQIGVSVYKAIRRVGGHGYPAPKVAHKQGLGPCGELTPHCPVLLLCCHQVSPYRPHVSMDGILFVEVTPLAVHDEADVDMPYVLQICVDMENEQEGSGMACRAGWGARRLKGILIDEHLEIHKAKALHLEGPPCRHEPYIPEAETLLTL